MINKIIKDIKSGENLDAFLAILLAFILCFLDLFGVNTSIELKNSFTIALLGILAFLLLKQRYEIANIKNTSIQESIFASAGFLNLTSSLDFNLLKKGIESSNIRIYILDNWICENLNALESQLVDALNRGVDIKIALLNPESEIAKQRSRDLKKSDHNFVSNQIRSNIDDLKTIFSKCHNPNLTVVLYSSLPTVELFVFDDELIYGNFLVGIESRYNPHIQLNCKVGGNSNINFTTTLLNNFHNVFSISTKII